mmetsp:Transcript_110197/g.310788  ORF Transcript_110197/g.310788 Transcript_110197/m.310788 type:complete len:228 (+) Transcript_110197:2102-2785(+)
MLLSAKTAAMASAPATDPSSPMPFHATSTSAKRPPSWEFLWTPRKRAAAPPPERKFPCKESRMMCVCPPTNLPSSVPSWIWLWLSSSRMSFGQNANDAMSTNAAALLSPTAERSRRRSSGSLPCIRSAGKVSKPLVQTSLRARTSNSVCKDSAPQSVASPTPVSRASCNRHRRICAAGSNSVSHNSASNCWSPKPVLLRSSSSPRQPSRVSLLANFGRSPRFLQASS